MKLTGAGNQAGPHFGYRADGSIASGSAGQLVLPVQRSRSFLLFMNISDTAMYLEFGSARAHCALTSGVVTSVTMDNVGFGFTLPPHVHFIGGQCGVASSLVAAGMDPDQQSPVAATNGSPASGVAVITSTTVASITIQNGGSGYQNPPLVWLTNHRMDPLGCADPSIGPNGILVPANGGSYYVNGTVCTTDAVAVYCASTGKKFTCLWLP